MCNFSLVQGYSGDMQHTIGFERFYESVDDDVRLH